MTETQDSESTMIVLLKCSICKLLVPKVDVRVHTANHFTKTEHICDTCGKSFSENFSLQNHMRLHTGRIAEYHVIPPNPPSLQKMSHLCNIFSGEKPFMCSYCEKTFRTREGLKDHEDIIHTKVGLKHCAACGEEFTTNRGLKSHMNLKHGVEERFQCKYCGFYFLSAEGHRAHEELAPCKANTCDICGRMYFQALRHHHSINPLLVLMFLSVHC